MGNIHKEIFFCLCLIQCNMIERLSRSVGIGAQKSVFLLLPLSVRQVMNRNIYLFPVITEVHIGACLLIKLNHILQLRMQLKHLLHRTFQQTQIYPGIQTIKEGQIGRCVAPHYIGKEHLHTSQRILGSPGIVGTSLSFFFLCHCFQLQNRCMTHQLIQSNGNLQIIVKIRQQKHTAHGVQSSLVKLCINAKTAVSQHI